MHNANSPWYDHVSRASDCLTATANTVGHFRTASYHSSRVCTSTDKKEAATDMMGITSMLTASRGIDRSFSFDHSHSRLRNLQSSRIRDASYLSIQRPAQARSEMKTSQHETNWNFSLETRTEQRNGEEVDRTTLESKRSRCAAGIFGLAYGHRALLPGTARDIAHVRLRHYRVPITTTSANGSAIATRLRRDRLPTNT